MLQGHGKNVQCCNVNSGAQAHNSQSSKATNAVLVLERRGGWVKSFRDLEASNLVTATIISGRHKILAIS
jgi:hypothetical protein